VQAFLPQLLQQTHIEILAHGNFYKEDALEVADLVKSTLTPHPLPQSSWFLRRNIILPQGSDYIFQHTLTDPANVNHAIEYYLQVGSTTDRKLRAMLGLFDQMTNEPAFDQLRTKEQLGYIVSSGFRSSATTMGYVVLVQSERMPDYLESRVHAFLLRVGVDLEAMTAEEFEGHKRSLINKRLEKPKNLESETGRLWSHIGSEYFDFYQIDNEVALVRQLTKAEMQSFHSQYISPESVTRAKLSVHMIAQAPLAEASKLKVDVSNRNEDGTLSTINHSIADELPAQKRGSILQETEKQLESLLIAPKIKPLVEEKEGYGTDVSRRGPTPIVINDVDMWKASMTVSESPRPLNDLSQFI
jgi:insulysin